MASHITELQQLYIAYFNRPADAAGLVYFDDLLSAGIYVNLFGVLPMRRAGMLGDAD